jgi:hypothetical protein
MKYALPILIYFGLKPKEIKKYLPDTKANSIYHARKQMEKQGTVSSVSSIMTNYNMEKVLKNNKK